MRFKKRWTFTLEILILVITCVVVGLTVYKPTPDDSIDMKIRIEGARDHSLLHKNPKGELRYSVTMNNGTSLELSPDELTQRIYNEQIHRKWWDLRALLNVTSPIGFIWVSVGFLGQVLFTGRMVVQIISSEREKKSIVPPAFWWMSLIGSTMLLIYFGWRQDPVGLLGQAFGWFIYVRNLWLIYGKEVPTETPKVEAK